MSLSRNYTLLTLMGLIRIKSGKLQNTLLTRAMLIDTIYTCLLEIARELKEADTPEFGTTSSIGVAAIESPTATLNLADVDGIGTKLNVESIIKLTGVADSAGVQIIPTDAVEYNYLADYPQAEGDVFWYRDGEIIYLFKGSDITTLTNIVIHYDRIPEKAILDATYIDLSDRFVPLLIAKVLEVIK